MTAPAVEQEQRRRRSWRCVDCEVVARRIDGDPLFLPAGWDGDLMLCLACQRARARAEFPGTATGLIKFELLRGTPPRTIASRACCSNARVAAVRKAMAEEGVRLPEPTKPKPTRPRGDARERATEELRRDPDRATREVARALGVSHHTVARARRDLGLPPPPAAVPAPRRPRSGWREEVLGVLREDGPVTGEGLAEATGTPVVTARGRLKVLRKEGLAASEQVPGTPAKAFRWRATAAP